jgi:eukaryotic-like serine/threonine-protein kinase
VPHARVHLVVLGMHDAALDPMTTTDLGDEPSGPSALRLAMRMPGERLGPWIVQRTLGAGAMGVVYAVRHAGSGRRAAVKVLHPRGYTHATTDPRDWLRKEAAALGRLSHPGIVDVQGIGEVDGLCFMVMELVEGSTLAAWLAHRRRTWPQVARVMRDVAAAIAAAHAAGLVHGDIKPDNIMITRRGSVRVMDFGLAEAMGTSIFESTAEEATQDDEPELEHAATRRHATVPRGTPAYMAPERLSGEPGDPATDQFSLCVTFYEALYGQRPFRGRTPAELYFRATRPFLRVAPAGARVPAWLHAIVARGLSKDPTQRWTSLHALVGALDRRMLRRRFRNATLVAAAIAAAVVGSIAAPAVASAFSSSGKPVAGAVEPDR